ncbi:hypothetical protein PGB90_001472 [Kerria lacca]
MIISDAEDIIKFTNRFHDAIKCLIASGVKLDEKIVRNYCIALKSRFPELCRRFDVQNNIKFDEMKNLALSIESTEKESKARVEETSTIANVIEKNENSHKLKSVICFRCGRPNYLASDCTNPKRICYNCGKLGSYTEKECTSSKTYFPTNAKFPSGRVRKITSSFRGTLFRGCSCGRSFNRGNFRGRGNQSSSHQKSENI